MVMRGGEPQQQAGQLQSKLELRELVETIFPQEELVYAFGYGSGVFVQQDKSRNDSSDNNPKMIDLILVVKDSKAFHQSNLQMNPHHYNTFQNISWVNWLQRHDVAVLDTFNLFRNPKVYFNLVSEPWMKYGVVQWDDLQSDLCHWDSLYLAGRMHKPTLPIPIAKENDTMRHSMISIESWQLNYNLPAAWSLAMLLISSKLDHGGEDTTTTTTTCGWENLYHSIAQLSYTGDIRMQMGAEDPQKVSKLVESPGQLERFHDLYRPSLEKSYNNQGSAILEMTPNEITWQATSPLLWKNLPPRLEELQSQFYKAGPNQRQHILLKALQNIVAPAARYQSFKGLFTAGLIKSAQYAGAKLSKGILRRK